MKQKKKIHSPEAIPARVVCWLAKDEEELDVALIMDINYILKLNDSDLRFKLNDPFDYQSFKESKIDFISTPIDMD